MQEQENFKNQFCIAANSLTKLYMTGLENQKQMYNNGVKDTVEKISNFIKFTNEKKGNISIDELQNFMMTLVQDGSNQPKEKIQIQNTQQQKENSWIQENNMTISLNEFHFDSSVTKNSDPFQVQTSLMPEFTFQNIEKKEETPFFNNTPFTFDLKQPVCFSDFVIKNDDSKKRVPGESHNELTPVKRTKN